MKNIVYKNGKRTEVEVNPLKEFQKELVEPEEETNLAVIAKRTLYAGLPKSQIKKDKSLTARMLNTSLESYNKARNTIKSRSYPLQNKAE